MAKKMTIDDLAAIMKEGFERFATKDDLKAFATREELDAKFDEVLTVGDAVVSLIKESREELAASRGARDRQQQGIDNHETRIIKLEKACKLTI